MYQEPRQWVRNQRGIEQRFGREGEARPPYPTLKKLKGPIWLVRLPESRHSFKIVCLRNEGMIALNSNKLVPVCCLITIQISVTYFIISISNCIPIKFLCHNVKITKSLPSQLYSHFFSQKFRENNAFLKKLKEELICLTNYLLVSINLALFSHIAAHCAIQNPWKQLMMKYNWFHEIIL